MDKNLKKEKFVFYEEPSDLDGEWFSLKDVNGKMFWVDWTRWLRESIYIDTPQKINLLPKEIAIFVPKWETLIEGLKEKNYHLPYPIKLATLDFIYDEKMYKLKPDAFLSTKVISKWTDLGGEVREHQMTDEVLFSGASSRMIEEDLRNIGCIYTSYNDFLD